MYFNLCFSLPGMIKVIVTATNSISSLNATNQIRAIERIQGIQSKAQNPVVNLDEDVVVNVDITGGAYGEITVVFVVENNVSLTKYFLNQLNRNISTLHFKHR